MNRERLRLYAVTDRHCLQETDALCVAVEQAILGGATMVQLREKERTGEALLTEAREVQAVCQRYHVPFIMNNEVALALQLDADGVHVGQSDMPAAEARRLLGPEKLLGVTARTVEEAKKAEADGADYLGSGAVFGSSTKLDAKVMSRETFTAITHAVKIPVVAIGGITVGNAEELRGCGAAGIAVVRGLFGEKNITDAARTLREIADTFEPYGR